MKLGIRRYQNEDGTLTPAGLKRQAKFDKEFKTVKKLAPTATDEEAFDRHDAKSNLSSFGKGASRAAKYGVATTAVVASVLASNGKENFNVNRTTREEASNDNERPSTKDSNYEEQWSKYYQVRD